MAVTTTELPKGKDLNEMIRHPIATLQETIETFETQARDRLRGVLSTGNSRLLELDGRLAKVQKDDWTVPGMRKHLEELRVYAETLRDHAVKRVEKMPAEAVGALVSGSRGPIQNLARSLADMAKKLEPGKAAKDAAKAEATKLPAKAARPPAAEKVEAKA